MSVTGARRFDPNDAAKRQALLYRTARLKDDMKGVPLGDLTFEEFEALLHLAGVRPSAMTISGPTEEDIALLERKMETLRVQKEVP